MGTSVVVLFYCCEWIEFDLLLKGVVSVDEKFEMESWINVF